MEKNRKSPRRCYHLKKFTGNDQAQKAFEVKTDLESGLRGTGRAVSAGEGGQGWSVHTEDWSVAQLGVESKPREAFC